MLLALVIRPSGAGFWPPLLSLLALIAVRLLFRREVELTPTRLIEQVLFRQVRQAIPWSRIRLIDVHRTFGLPQVRVVSDDGGIRYLPAPRATAWFWLDRRFAADYLRISQWWVEHRGADWQPRPVAPRPEQPGARSVAMADPWVSEGWVWRGRQHVSPDVRK